MMIPGLMVLSRAPRLPHLTASVITRSELPRCINVRLPTSGGLYAWEFEEGGREVNIRVEGQLTFNTLWMRLRAARAGLGIVFVPEDIVQTDIDAGRFVRVLTDWCAPFPGYHLYYPHRRQDAPAFAVLVAELRYRSTPVSVRRSRRR